MQDRNRSFDGLAIYSMARVGLDAGVNPTRAWLYEVSGNYFDVVRNSTVSWPLFHSSDERGANSAPYIVLSYGIGRHFQDDRAVVGRTVKLNKRPFTIIGVAPRAFKVLSSSKPHNRTKRVGERSKNVPRNSGGANR